MSTDLPTSSTVVSSGSGVSSGAGRDVFIGNLSLFTDNAKLREYFESGFGEGSVDDVRIMFHPETGRSRRFGFVTFKTPATATAVMAQEHSLDGKVMDIKYAHKSSNNNNNNVNQRKDNNSKATPQGESDGGGKEGKVTKVFVGGVSQETKVEEFRTYFSQFGTLESVNLLKDMNTGRNRGFGFLVYKDERSVDHLCSVQFHMLKGKRVEVKRAKDPFNSGRSVGSGKGNHSTPLGPFHPGPGPYRGGISGRGYHPYALMPRVRNDNGVLTFDHHHKGKVGATLSYAARGRSHLLPGPGHQGQTRHHQQPYGGNFGVPPASPFPTVGSHQLTTAAAALYRQCVPPPTTATLAPQQTTNTATDFTAAAMAQAAAIQATLINNYFTPLPAGASQPFIGGTEAAAATASSLNPYPFFNSVYQTNIPTATAQDSQFPTYDPYGQRK